MSSRKSAKSMIELPPRIKAQIERRARAENCNSPGEFVALLFREKIESEERDRLEELLLEGLVGDALPVNDIYWKDLRGRVRARSGTGASIRKRKRP